MAERAFRIERREWLALWGGAWALTCVFFARAAFSTHVFLIRDIQRVYYPLRHFWAQRIHAGHFPQWYPYDGMGEPFIGLLLSSPFHPLNLLYLVMPLGPAMTWNLLACYAVAFTGTYLLLRSAGCARPPSVAAAVVFAFCGYALCINNNLTYWMSAVMVPWTLYFSHQQLMLPSVRRAFLAALSWVLVLLGGDPQAFVGTGICLAALLAFPSATPLATRAVRLGVVMAGAAALGAVQILPTLKLKAEAWAMNAPTDTVLRFSGHPMRLLEMLWGPLWLRPSGHEMLSEQLGRYFDATFRATWVDSEHVGVVPLALAVFALAGHPRARATKVLTATFGLFLLLWMGRFAGLYTLFHLYVPLWGAFRYPEKLTPFLMLLLAAGAALGLQRLEGEEGARRGLVRLFAALLVATGLGVLAEAFGNLYSHGLLHRLWAELPDEQLRALGASFVRLGWVSMAALAGAAAVTRWFPARARGYGLVAVCALHLFFANRKVYEVGSAEVLREPPAFVQTMEAADGPLLPGRFRIAMRVGQQAQEVAVHRLRQQGIALHTETPLDYVSLFTAAALRPDVGELWNLETTDVYLPMASRRVLGMHPLSEGGLFNTRYAVVNPEVVGSLHLTDPVLARLPVGLALLKLQGYIERAYLAKPQCTVNTDSAWLQLRAAGFRRGQDVLIECGAQGLPEGMAAAAGEGGAARMTRYEPERVDVHTEAPTATMLVLNDAFYSGWRATLDGVPVPIFPANALVRAVAIPTAGSHEVSFRYQTPGLDLGIAGSAAGLLTFAGAGVWERRRDRRRKRAG